MVLTTEATNEIPIPDGGALVEAPASRRDDSRWWVERLGGERGVDGACVRTTCSATDECGGGHSCVDGRCRNLCDTDRDCEGGEACDAAEGVCRPADTGGGDGGCSCRAPGTSSNAVPFASLAFDLAFLLRRGR